MVRVSHMFLLSLGCVLQADPEQKILTRMSASIWMSNPGYLVRDGMKTISVAKSDYVWDQDEVRKASRSACPGAGHPLFPLRSYPWL